VDSEYSLVVRQTLAYLLSVINKLYSVTNLELKTSSVPPIHNKFFSVIASERSECGNLITLSVFSSSCFLFYVICTEKNNLSL